MWGNSKIGMYSVKSTYFNIKAWKNLNQSQYLQQGGGFMFFDLNIQN